MLCRVRGAAARTRFSCRAWCAGRPGERRGARESSAAMMLPGSEPLTRRHSESYLALWGAVSRRARRVRRRQFSMMATPHAAKPAGPKDLLGAVLIQDAVIHDLGRQGRDSERKERVREGALREREGRRQEGKVNRVHEREE